MTALDQAIAAYRENPSEENKAALLAAQQNHTSAFLARNATEYIARTKTTLTSR